MTNQTILETAIEANIVEDRPDGLFFGGNNLGESTQIAVDEMARDPGLSDQLSAAVEMETAVLVVIEDTFDDVVEMIESEAQLATAAKPAPVDEQAPAVEKQPKKRSRLQTSMAHALTSAGVNKKSFPRSKKSSKKRPARQKIEKVNPLAAYNELVQHLASPKGAQDYQTLADEVAKNSSSLIDQARINSGLVEAEKVHNMISNYSSSEVDTTKLEKERAGLWPFAKDLEGEYQGLNQLVEQAIAAGVDSLAQKYREQAAGLETNLDALNTECARLDLKIKSAQADATSAYQQKLSVAQINVDEAKARFEALRGDMAPSEKLLLQVKEAVGVQADFHLDKLEKQIGAQSSKILLERARKLRLGIDRIAKLELLIKERNGWISAWTPEARNWAQKLAAEGEADGNKIHPNAKTVQLRADRILSLDKNNREVQAFAFTPNGSFFEAGLKRGRSRKVTGKDEWTVNR